MSKAERREQKRREEKRREEKRGKDEQTAPLPIPLSKRMPRQSARQGLRASVPP
jgi:hypothetical protein